MKIDIIGGFDKGRSPGIDSQECMNFYAEKSSGNGKEPSALIGTPGKSYFNVFSQTTSACRGLFCSSGDRLFAVAGNLLLELDGISFTTRGTLTTYIGKVTFAENVNVDDNTTQIMIADGANGYVFALETNTFTQISDGDYLAGSHVIYHSGFFVQNVLNSNKFIFSDLYDGLSWDALNYYAAEGNADDVTALGKINNEIWVFGQKGIEIWYSTGDSNDPFSRVNNVFIDIGIAAVHSIGTINNTIFWLGSNSQGDKIVWMSNGYSPQRISNHAIEYQISQMLLISDAMGFCYQQEGHYFYVLSFQSGNKTFVYDMSTGLWHQRGYYNSFSGDNDRDRAIYHTFWKGYNIVADYSDPTLYYLNQSVYTDWNNTIKRVRTTPHLTVENKRISINSFELEIERGVGLVSGQGSDPQVMLQVSKDGGYTWGNEIWASMGKIGGYKTRVRWTRLGCGRDFVFKVTITDPVKCVIIGAYADVEVLE